MNNQVAADDFAEKLRSTMNTIEPKTEKAKHHEEIVSLNIKETNFKASNLSEEERKPTEVKPATLKSILRNRKNTATGPDGTKYQLIKQLRLENVEILAQTFQTSKQLGHVPAPWKTATVIMIPKVIKDHETLKRYRPSCLGKLCKNIVIEHLVNHCGKLKLFGNQQSAYRYGRCTTKTF